MLKTENGESTANGSSATSLYSQSHHKNATGMSFLVTALFIVGETAGGGLIALPSAMVAPGLYYGTMLIVIGAIICMYTGVLLSENWTILQLRYSEYRVHCRKPYPAMGLKAIGPRFSALVSFTLQLTQFGTAVVFILLGAKNCSFLLAAVSVEINFCAMIFIVSLFILPATMLKSPKDFWGAIVMAMITTSMAVGFIIFGALNDKDLCQPIANYPEWNPTKSFMCFGTIMFSLGGHGAFPNIQHDMKEPHRFKLSVILAYTIIAVMYIPVSLTGYYVYGDALTDSVIPSLQNPFIQSAVNILITLHVVLALIIVFNPLNQEIEEFFKLSHDFGPSRIISRSIIMAVVAFTAASVPNFGVLLDLVGSSTITLMALVYPVIFNLFLAASYNLHKDQTLKTDRPLTLLELFIYTPKSKLIMNVFILLIATIGGFYASYTAAVAMTQTEFREPCYIEMVRSWTREGEDPFIPHHGHSKYACCGPFKNITRYENSAEYCVDPLMKASFGGGH
ncbi:hypothetical protein WR25_14555 [Diploscapter pachys]|uniref:Amino acid transporter transmembrane domain-containing protein n=1 Tax=Diploscapter pachys TaxID=2018661 RepID=A0A2A2L555_9BILA|nr:hypothetical protein WR25_14555 [Diploscapter pachys]